MPAYTIGLPIDTTCSVDHNNLAERNKRWTQTGEGDATWRSKDAEVQIFCSKPFQSGDMGIPCQIFKVEIQWQTLPM